MLKKRETGENIYQLLPVEPETVRGFNRLPAPCPADLYFDMEGNPLEDDGLEYLPRYLDFLFSRKRLNVVLSRARCLAILIANPRLLETACNTVEQMGLINTLCRVYCAGVSDFHTLGKDWV